MTKEEFEEETGYLLTKKDNRLYYDDDLMLFKSEIKNLPDNLIVNGYLSLSYSKIQSLPNNLTVKGDLYLDHTNIKELPHNLVVENDLYISPHTLITSLPKDLIVGDCIYCNSIDLKNTGLYLFSKNIGSRKQITQYSILQDIIICGIFKGTLDEFIIDINKRYPDLNNKHKAKFIEHIKKYKIFKFLYLKYQYRKEYYDFIKQCKYQKYKFLNSK